MSSKANSEALSIYLALQCNEYSMNCIQCWCGTYWVVRPWTWFTNSSKHVLQWIHNTHIPTIMLTGKQN